MAAAEDLARGSSAAWISARGHNECCADLAGAGASWPGTAVIALCQHANRCEAVGEVRADGARDDEEERASGRLDAERLGGGDAGGTQVQGEAVLFGDPVAVDAK